MIVLMKSNHIICVTETKLNSDDLTHAYFITDRYISYRKDRGAVEDGGGVIILVKSPIVSEQIFNQLWANL